MMEFSHYNPTRIVFGAGKLASISGYLPAAVSNVLLVSTSSAAEVTGAKRIIALSMESSGRKLVYFNKVSPNPRTTEVDEALAICDVENIDAVVAVGGGSAIDAGKAIALGAATQQSSGEMLKSDIKESESLFLVAVPTTAGTGSEVSKGAILTDTSRSWKGGLRGEALFPNLALLDPSLLRSVPKGVAIETGFDILTHSLESIVSLARTPITEVYSKMSIRLAVPAICELVNDQADDATRANLMLASLLAGFNLANSSTCLPHRLQYPLGANTDSAHARGLAALYPAWFRHTYQFAPEPFNFFAKAVAESLCISDYVETKEGCLRVLKAFLEFAALDERLGNFGVSEDDCKRFALQVDGNLRLDPGKSDQKTIETIYLESL